MEKPKIKNPARGETRQGRQKSKFWYRFALMFFLFFLFKIVFAENAAPATNSASDQQTIQKKQQQIEDLQQKAESYKQMIEMKQNKASTLQNQIDLMESQISSLEADVAKLQGQIDTTSQDISALSLKIEEKEKEIGNKKELLGNVLQEYYENNRDSLVELMLRNTTLSDFLSQPDYVSQTGTKIDEVLASVTSARDELSGSKKTLEEKNNDLKEKQGQINEKKHHLDNEQESKAALLDATQGEEQKYQDLLARVELQKQELLGDIEELSQEKSSDIAAVEATLEKPKSGLASTSWYFSQRDSKWGDQNIGFSNTKMKSYGCAVTAVAMVLRYHGVDVDPGALADAPIFYHDLIVWPKSWKGVELVSSNGHGNIDWKVIDTELKNKNPVIVFVKATKRGAGHYVVIHGKDKSGDYVVHDPYWGSNIFLSSTRAYVGALYGSGTEVDQMIIYH